MATLHKILRASVRNTGAGFYRRVARGGPIDRRMKTVGPQRTPREGASFGDHSSCWRKRSRASLAFLACRQLLHRGERTHARPPPFCTALGPKTNWPWALVPLGGQRGRRGAAAVRSTVGWARSGSRKHGTRPAALGGGGRGEGTAWQRGAPPGKLGKPASGAQHPIDNQARPGASHRVTD